MTRQLKPGETCPECGNYRFPKMKLIDFLHPNPNDPLHRTSEMIEAEIVSRVEMEEFGRLMSDE